MRVSINAGTQNGFSPIIYKENPNLKWMISGYTLGNSHMNHYESPTFRAGNGFP